MKLGTINKLLAVVIVIGMGVLLAQQLHDAHQFTALVSEVATPRVTSKATLGWNQAVHYSPDENLEGIDIGILDHAKRKLDIAMYSFTDRPIEQELITLAKHQVQIRIYRDKEQYREEKQRAAERGEMCVTDELAAVKNIRVKIKGGEDLMHEKDYDVDGYLLRSGSANWSIGGLRRQDNVAIYTQAPKDAVRFEKKFEEMWSRSDNIELK